MKRPLSILLVLFALVALTAPAYAQDVTRANFPFSFTVANKVMPAGNYLVKVDLDAQIVTLTPERGVSVVAPIITRLAQRNATTNPEVVFDRVNNQYYISEVWFPAMDGFLIKDTRGAHSHEVVSVPKG